MTNAINSLTDDFWKMHIKIAQEVLQLKSFSDHIFEQGSQIACLIAHDLHSADQTRLTDGNPEAMPFSAHALPIEDVGKGFIFHQNVSDSRSMATVRYPLKRRLSLLPYRVCHVVDKRGGDCPTKGKGRQQGGATVGQPQLEFAERRQLLEELPAEGVVAFCR